MHYPKASLSQSKLPSVPEPERLAGLRRANSHPQEPGVCAAPGVGPTPGVGPASGVSPGSGVGPASGVGPNLVLARFAV